ncbi:MAG: stage II sporulation protein P, partial [Priestia megaterium]
RSILIEVGGVDNNMEELTNTVKAFSDVFSEYYWQAEKVNAQ